jgi:predicted secreted protein
MQTRGSANIEGLDISAYQTITNAADLFADYPNYIYLRAYGSAGSPDTTFVSRVALAKSYNVPSGGYYFAMPSKALGNGGEAECDTQCDQFIAKLQEAYGAGKYGDLIPMLDVEAWDATVTPMKPMYYGLTGAQVIDWVKRYRDRFYNTTKRRLGFYSNRYFLTGTVANECLVGLTTAKLSEISNMPLWLAEYDQYYPENVPPTGAPASLGGWTTYALWQWAVVADADQHGLSHGENKVDHDRTDSVDRIKPPPPPTSISAQQTGDNELTVYFTRPNIIDYLGASVYINGVWKKWVAANAADLATIDITAYGRNVDVSYQVIVEDSYSDFGNSEIKTIRLFPTKAESDVNIMPVASMGTVLKKATTAIAELTSIDGVSVSMDTVETTTLDTIGGYRTFINGLRDAGEVSISGHFAYTGHKAMFDDFESGASASYTIEFPDKITTTGTKWTFTAIVTAFGTSVDLEDLITFEATLKISGKPSLTAPV